jgi:H+/Cl- antiporter ClcA
VWPSLTVIKKLVVELFVEGEIQVLEKVGDSVFGGNFLPFLLIGIPIGLMMWKIIVFCFADLEQQEIQECITQGNCEWYQQASLNGLLP